MRIIEPYHEILFLPSPQQALELIELAGRTCYKSEDKMARDSAESFIRRIVQSGHESVIEHSICTVRIVCDRGVSHELVRHRLAGFSQESTRYANYSQDRFGNEITVINPCFWPKDSSEYQEWYLAMEQAEATYMRLLKMGASPQQARSVLPNSLKTEVVMSCNFREWRHVFTLRCSKAAHPQIREVMSTLLSDLKQRVPVIFDDL